MFCHKCGATLKNEAEFCSVCGSRVNEPSSQPTQMQPATEHPCQSFTLQTPPKASPSQTTSIAPLKNPKGRAFLLIGGFLAIPSSLFILIFYLMKAFEMIRYERFVPLSSWWLLFLYAFVCIIMLTSGVFAIVCFKKRIKTTFLIILGSISTFLPLVLIVTGIKSLLSYLSNFLTGIAAFPVYPLLALLVFFIPLIACLLIVIGAVLNKKQ